MHWKIISKWFLIIVGVELIVFFSIIIVFFSFDLTALGYYSQPVLETSAPVPPKQIARNSFKPARDIVSKEEAKEGTQNIYTDSAVEYVSLSAQGSYGKPILKTSNAVPQKSITQNSFKPDWNIVFNGAAKVGLPVRLEIPKIDVDSAVEYVGLASDGSMDVPKRPENVAWYQPGVRPGDIGSAVIAGHFGFWKNGEGSVFDELNKLKRGDLIYIHDEKGEIITFVVRELKIFEDNEDAASVFISNDNKAHLNLITCQGNWDKVTQSYPKRLVVFAD